MTARGFTLVEMLITIAVIVALLTLLMPAFRGALSDTDRRAAQAHAQTVRLALNTLLASNPQLSTATFGTVACTAAADVTPAGVVTAAGGNGWDAAPSGSTCSATALTARTYRATVTLADGRTVTAP